MFLRSLFFHFRKIDGRDPRDDKFRKLELRQVGLLLPVLLRRRRRLDILRRGSRIDASRLRQRSLRCGGAFLRLEKEEGRQHTDQQTKDSPHITVSPNSSAGGRPRSLSPPPSAISRHFD